MHKPPPPQTHTRTCTHTHTRTCTHTQRSSSRLALPSCGFTTTNPICWLKVAGLRQPKARCPFCPPAWALHSLATARAQAPGLSEMQRNGTGRGRNRTGKTKGVGQEARRARQAAGRERRGREGARTRGSTSSEH